MDTYWVIVNSEMFAEDRHESITAHNDEEARKTAEELCRNGFGFDWEIVAVAKEIPKA